MDMACFDHQEPSGLSHGDDGPSIWRSEVTTSLCPLTPWIALRASPS